MEWLHKSKFLNIKFIRTPIIVILIGVFAVIIRFGFELATLNYNKVETWEYGSIAENLANGKGYSLFYFENDKLNYKYHSTKIPAPYPSAYMPPLYPLMISPVFLSTKTTSIQNFAILFLNKLFDFFTIILLYKSFENFNKHNLALITISIFALLPDFIFASSKVGVSSLYFFLISALIYGFYKNKSAYFLSFILSLLILTRSEYILFAFIYILYLLKSKEFKKAIVLIAIISLFQLPWIIRNQLQFKTFITGTTSLGINLYRGHNPYYQSSWGDERIDSIRLNLKNSDNFELEMNRMYLHEAKSSIINNPQHEFNLLFQKLSSILWINDENLSRFSLLYNFSNLFFMILCVWNLIKIKFSKFNANFNLIGFNILIGILFFIIPRYVVMMKISMLPFVSMGLINIYSLFKERTFSFLKKDVD